MDDDREAEFLHTALARLLDYYIASGMNSIVGLRVRRLGFCDTQAWKLIEYSVCNWPQVAYSNYIKNIYYIILLVLYCL